MVHSRTSLLQLRRPSLLRGTLLAIIAFAISLRLGGFPDLSRLHSSRWQILAALMAFWGMIETVRCLGRRWNLYHAGVLILLYTDLMILAMAVVLFLYP